ncbi:hypothetical protein AALO_G00200810 [Alosa alosa]|uniref:Uncharacterized protein n=1 Tax=Alosa alosa TaxID=278164 RepID=A0AAV6G755_9TELE|nr:hypothetical protein AALO_G00200810 [Alosa alosa]
MSKPVERQLPLKACEDSREVVMTAFMPTGGGVEADVLKEYESTAGTLQGHTHEDLSQGSEGKSTFALIWRVVLLSKCHFTTEMESDYTRCRIFWIYLVTKL